jgi:hypothetical protein
MAAANELPINEDSEIEEASSRGMDPELRELGGILRTLNRMAPDAANRVVAYIAARWKAGA